jgi:RHS repeat-associated protein
VDEPLWELTGATSGPSANARYYHADGLGSVVALSAVSSGALTSERRYDAWGKVLPGASGPTEYGFTGREPDETGLVYYRARYYEPTLGRFVSMDPAGMPDGVNRYAYVGNDPVGMVDPSGMVASSVLAASGFTSYMPGGTMTDAPMGGFNAGAQRLPANQGQQANTWGTQDYVENDGGAVTGVQMPRVAGERTMSAWEYTGLAVTTIGVANLPFAAASAGRWAVTTLGAAAARGGSAAARVRHHTSPESIASIRQQGVINPSRGGGVHVEAQPFGPARTASQETGAFGRGGYVEFDAPPGLVPTNVGPRVTGVIPSTVPLSLEGANPIFVSKPWWKFW